jgi:hypothetical protein
MMRFVPHHTLRLLRHAFTTPSLAGEGRGEGDLITAELAKLLNQNEMLRNIFVAICFYYPKKISWTA